MTCDRLEIKCHEAGSLGKWLQNKIWTLFITNWREGLGLFSGTGSQDSVCVTKHWRHSSLSGIAWRRPVLLALISEWPRSQGSRGLGYLFSLESDVSSPRPKWCNFNLIFNGAVSLRFLKTKLLFHSHIAFTEDNYSSSAILASLLHSLHCIKWKSEIGIEMNWIKFPFWPLDFLWLYWRGRWFLFIIYQFLFKFLHTLAGQALPWVCVVSAPHCLAVITAFDSCCL